jgi:hypothetical protein
MISLKQPSIYVGLNQQIPRSKFKTVSFKQATEPGKDGTTVDVSILTVVNTETNENVDLVLNRVADSPESFAQFKYLWTAPGGQPMAPFTKRKKDTFTLTPETDKIYKVEDIREVTEGNRVVRQEVTLELPDGKKLVLSKTP